MQKYTFLLKKTSFCREIGKYLRLICYKNKNAYILQYKRFLLLCAPKRSRTSNRLIRSQVLYPVELWAHTYS